MKHSVQFRNERIYTKSNEMSKIALGYISNTNSTNKEYGQFLSHFNSVMYMYGNKAQHKNDNKQTLTTSLSYYISHISRKR